jgi:hypothetical protein
MVLALAAATATAAGPGGEPTATPSPAPMQATAVPPPPPGEATVMPPVPIAPVPTPEPGTAAAPAPPTGVVWSELRYAAHKLFLSATTTVRAASVPAAELAKILRQPPRGRAVPIPSAGAVGVSVASVLPFGRDEDVTLWLDPASGAAIGGEKTSLGGSPYHKLMRYTDGGLYTWRSAPRDAAEAAGPPAGWSAHSNYLVEATAPPPPGVPVTDSYVLLYLVSAARLDDNGNSLRVVTLNRDRYVEISFTAGGLSYQRASFTESWPGGGTRRDGNVLVRAVRGTARIVGEASGRDDVDLGFLGMRGALTMFVEVGTGIPIAFSGRVDYAGTLNVRLTRARLLTAPTGVAAAPPTRAPAAPTPAGGTPAAAPTAAPGDPVPTPSS